MNIISQQNKRLNYMFFLRFILSIIVLIIHSAESISWHVENHFIGDAVLIFFFLSGYANFISWRGDSGIRNNIYYLIRRMGKIISISLFIVIFYSIISLDWSFEYVRVTFNDFVNTLYYPFIGKNLGRDYSGPGIFTIWSLLVEFWLYIYFSLIMLIIKYRKLFLFVLISLILLPLILLFNSYLNIGKLDSAIKFYWPKADYYNIFLIGSTYFFSGVLLAFVEVKYSNQLNKINISKLHQTILVLFTLIIPIFGRYKIWYLVNIFSVNNSSLFTTLHHSL